MSTYTPIASVNVNGFTTVTFNNISSNFTDLIVVGSGLTRGTANSIFVRFNGDSASNYSYTQLVGNGSAASSSRSSNQTGGMVGAGTSGLSSTPTMFICQVQNYGNATTYKTYLSRDTDSNGSTEAFVGLWRSTAAITSVTVYTGGDFTGGEINLYGIANASITNVAKATGGDSVYTDGTYWYHIFRSSGTFTPTEALTADYLVVAGGGGGGGSYAGGGGAGGLRCTVTATGGGGSLESALSLTAQAYTVTVGAGGTGGVGDNVGSDGNNSVFSTITSTGGGGGGFTNVNNGDGRTGGSGGGGAGSGTAGLSLTGGAGTANQGYAGGNGFIQSAVGPAAGGGGAGAVGSNGATNTAGNGGNGVATSITGSSVTYAGGGGGGIITGTAGSGGTGGGGAGSSTTNGTAGTANTGGGGGGADNNFNGGAGGSGIVIVRYAV